MPASNRCELTAESEKLLRKMQSFDGGPALRKRLNAATKPLVPALRAAARSIPSSRPYSADSLRSRLAKAVRRRVTVSRNTVRVYVNVARRSDTMPLMVEGIKHWRHPVFPKGDNRANWEWTEQPSSPWFFKTVERMIASIDKAIEQVIRDYEKQL